jgi:hypothetical protein
METSNQAHRHTPSVAIEAGTTWHGRGDRRVRLPRGKGDRRRCGCERCGMRWRGREQLLLRCPAMADWESRSMLFCSILYQEFTRSCCSRSSFLATTAVLCSHAAGASCPLRSSFSATHFTACSRCQVGQPRSRCLVGHPWSRRRLRPRSACMRIARRR